MEKRSASVLDAFFSTAKHFGFTVVSALSYRVFQYVSKSSHLMLLLHC